MRGKGLVSVFYVLVDILVSSIMFIEDAAFSLVYTIGFFVKIQIAVVVWSYIWVLSSSSLIYVSVLMLVPCWFCGSTVLKSGIIFGED